MWLLGGGGGFGRRGRAGWLAELHRAVLGAADGAAAHALLADTPPCCCFPRLARLKFPMLPPRACPPALQ